MNKEKMSVMEYLENIEEKDLPIAYEDNDFKINIEKVDIGKGQFNIKVTVENKSVEEVNTRYLTQLIYELQGMEFVKWYVKNMVRDMISKEKRRCE